MKNRLAVLTIVLILTACANQPELLETATQIARQASSGATRNSPLSNSDIIAGLKDALRVGSENVVGRLGAPNGFNADPKVHIPLPDSLGKARDLAAKFGLDGRFNDLELKLNRAAEAATPRAKTLFLSAIQQMTLEDAQGILKGPDDAATRYFQGKMSAPLAKEMQPIVGDAISRAGVIQTYDKAISGLGPAAPMLPNIKADLTNHVIEHGMDGIFHYLAAEEAAIRSDPVKRTTEILRKVFQ